MRPKNRPTKTTDLFSSAEFMELRREWYQKARDSGFVDLEREDGSFVDEDADRQMRKTLRDCPDRAEALASYYTEAERGLATLVFESPEDRAVWLHHARGSSIREIAELMGMSRQQVERRVAKHQKRLGIRRPR